MKVAVYQDRGGKWRWRLMAPNGRIMASSGESFASKSNAARAARGVMYLIRTERKVRIAYL